MPSKDELENRIQTQSRSLIDLEADNPSFRESEAKVREASLTTKLTVRSVATKAINNESSAFASNQALVKASRTSPVRQSNICNQEIENNRTDCVPLGVIPSSRKNDSSKWWQSFKCWQDPVPPDQINEDYVEIKHLFALANLKERSLKTQPSILLRAGQKTFSAVSFNESYSSRSKVFNYHIINVLPTTVITNPL